MDRRRSQTFRKDEAPGSSTSNNQLSPADGQGSVDTNGGGYHLPSMKMHGNHYNITLHGGVLTQNQNQGPYYSPYYVRFSLLVVTYSDS